MGELTPAQRSTFKSMFQSGLKLLKYDRRPARPLPPGRLQAAAEDRRRRTWPSTCAGWWASSRSPARKGIELKLVLETRSMQLWCDLERHRARLPQPALQRDQVHPSRRAHPCQPREKGPMAEVVVEDDGPGFRRTSLPSGSSSASTRWTWAARAATAAPASGSRWRRRSSSCTAAPSGRESSKGARVHRGAPARPRALPRPRCWTAAGPRATCREGQRANDRGLMDFAVQMAARDEYRLLDIAEATERRVSPARRRTRTAGARGAGGGRHAGHHPARAQLAAHALQGHLRRGRPEGPGDGPCASGPR